MSRKCEISGKSKLKGRRVSHSHIRTLCHRKVNLVRRRSLFDLETGQMFKFKKISARVLKTITKRSLSSVLKKYKKKSKG